MKTSSLEQLRATVGRFLIVVLWLHLPVLLAIGLGNGGSWAASLAIGAVVAAIATAARLHDEQGQFARYAIALALITMVSLIVSLSHGLMQADTHMYYFVAFAMLAAFCDWRVIVFSTVMTALHHLVLNFALPYSVFPDGGSIARVLLHAGIVIVEAGTLIWLTQHLVRLFAGHQASIDALEEAGQRERELAAERLRLNEQTQTERRRVTLDVARRFEASVKSVVDKVSEAARSMQETAAQLAVVAGKNRDEAQGAVGVLRETTESVHVIAAAVEELAASTDEIGQQVVQSAGIATGAVEEARRTDATVQGLAEAAQRIGEVVQLINDIASRRICSRSTLRSRRRGPVKRAGASRSWLRK